ncbi:polysaccharide biosynthesis tyrosine autokinase [Jejubacter calystegiae]|uniref:polysaccharide biosynthesis tyrosine autokinase n=1 Tax=Jejubacter calystegiae TaxID=2579935 RepID=UPI001F4FC188|nr:polysaccharide biosynthesis tyrosine autokinase [Jejubacter calystegiae]
MEEIRGQGVKSEEVDLIQILFSLLDHKGTILGIMLATFLVGMLWVVAQVPVWQADAMVQVDKTSSVNLLASFSELMPDSGPQSSTEAEIIRSRMVLGKTVAEMGLDTSVTPNTFPLVGTVASRLFQRPPERLTLTWKAPANLLEARVATLEVLDGERYRLTPLEGAPLEGVRGKPLHFSDMQLTVDAIDAPAGATFTLQKLPQQTAIERILQDFSVQEQGKGTGVLKLTYRGTDPVYIRKILNNLVHNYQNQHIAWRSEEVGRSLQFVDEQLPKVQEKLNQAEENLNHFRSQNDSVDLSLEAKSMLDSMVTVEAGLNELAFKEAELSKLYTHEHPAYRALVEKRRTLMEERRKLNQKVSSMPGTQQEVLRLTRDMESAQLIYTQLLHKQQELRISKAGIVGYVRIIDLAATESRPVAPRKALILALFLILGGVLGCGVALLKSAFRRGVRSVRELESMDLLVYASIPWCEKLARPFSFLRWNRYLPAVAGPLVLSQPNDLAVESFRGLRTSLHFALMEARNNVLMVVGPTPGLGKTFVSTNLATLFAQGGMRVLLIDCDLRRGDVHQILGCGNVPGLGEVLRGEMSINQTVVQSLIPGLFVLPSGKGESDVQEWLMSERLSTLLAEASAQYDLVILDTPPILAVYDALIIGRHVGSTLMVARFETTTREELETSLRRLRQNNIAVNGAILNATRRRRGEFYEYGLYHHYAYDSDSKP